MAIIVPYSLKIRNLEKVAISKIWYNYPLEAVDIKLLFVSDYMLEILFGALLGFLVFTLTSHPKSRIRKRLPNKKIKNIQVSPRLTISAKNRVFHFHHWMLLTPVFLFFQNMIHSDIIQGVLIGSIFQGLLYRDRFKFMVKKADHAKQVDNSSFHLPYVKKLLRRR